MEKNHNPIIEEPLFEEQEFDQLIFSAFQRQEMIHNINHDVIQDIRRTVFLRKARRWGRMVAFAFGVPLVLVLFLYLVFHYVQFGKTNLLVSVCIILPVLTMLITSGRAIGNFSFKESVII